MQPKKVVLLGAVGFGVLSFLVGLRLVKVWAEPQPPPQPPTPPKQQILIETPPVSPLPPKPPERKKPTALTPQQFAEYRRAIQETAVMVSNSKALNLASRNGLNILNVTWEDTGRYKDSSVGPNISDMTIQVSARDPKTEQLNVTCMPVIRHPNFSDKTCDLDPRDFTLLVGNQHGDGLRRISLYDFLEQPTAYLSNPDSWKSEKKTLLSARDTKVLVSAQACFLPIPKNGTATFNPVLFNYQSFKENPAVLTVLATREGTSVTVIDNTRDAFETGSVWGQRLFHNDNGQRASLTGTRESEFRSTNPLTNQTPSVGTEKKEAGLNMVLLVQIPLKQKQPARFVAADCELAAAPPASVYKSAKSSDVENAVIGHGNLEGPFTEIDNLDIERDDRFPVRVTVQFYKATSNGEVNERDLAEIKRQLDRVYAQSDYVGSLVTEGETGRATEYEGAKIQPADWWERFWERRQAETGERPEVTLEKLKKLLGQNYRQQPVTDLYLRKLLKSEKPRI